MTQEKTCTTCGEAKVLDGFSQQKRGKFGVHSRCRVCAAEYGKKYYQDNKESLLERDKKRYQDNRESILEYSKKYRQENKESIAEYRQENKESKAEYNKKYNRENKESLVEYFKKHYQENKESKAEYNKKYKRENRESLAEYSKKYYQGNKESIAEYRQENKPLYRAIKAKRRSCKLNATPPWLTEEHHEEIKAIYLKAQTLTEETGIPHHVDHQVPLQGKNVCGLHVPWNLDPLPASDNRKKHNTFDGGW